MGWTTQALRIEARYSSPVDPTRRFGRAASPDKLVIHFRWQRELLFSALPSLARNGAVSGKISPDVFVCSIRGSGCFSLSVELLGTFSLVLNGCSKRLIFQGVSTLATSGDNSNLEVRRNWLRVALGALWCHGLFHRRGTSHDTGIYLNGGSFSSREARTHVQKATQKLWHPTT